MRPVLICGLGAVSPAGWGVPALRGALDDKKALPIQSLARPGSTKPLRVREVPNPVPRPALLSHPRLRRTSPISHYAAAAATEAFASVKNSGANPPRLGLVLCLYCGCIQHSYRFFDEALKDPATASPLIFPETVFAAPASHLAALFHKPVLAQTLLGDPATMLQGVALAADWLMEDRVDLALVVGAEETNWLLADALWHFDHHSILAGGAGALCLSTNPAYSLGAQLARITEPFTYGPGQDRLQAAAQVRAQLPAGSPDQLLCDGLQNCFRTDKAERLAWRDWNGSSLSPKKVLGEGLMAAAAWQCVAACDAVIHSGCASALVSLVGCNQQAIGAQFVCSK